MEPVKTGQRCQILKLLLFSKSYSLQIVDKLDVFLFFFLLESVYVLTLVAEQR